MAIADILYSIDREIALLRQARELINDGSAARPRKNGHRSKAGTIENPSVANPAKKRKKRKLTPEGRRRIAEAVRRRWERHRKAAAAKSTKSAAR